GQIAVNSVKPCHKKYSALQIRQISSITYPARAAMRDDAHRHRSVARVAMDAAASGGFGCRTRRLRRTVKSCGPGAATLASIRPACAGLATGARKAVPRGEHV